MRDPRILHIRYYQGIPVHDKSRLSDRIVSIAYNWNPESKKLTYGATVWRKKTPQDNWDRRLHVVTIRHRFFDAPVKVQFPKGCSFMEDRVASFICNVGIETLGTHVREGKKTLSEGDLEYYGNYDFADNEEDVFDSLEEHMHNDLFVLEPVHVTAFSAGCVAMFTLFADKIFAAC